MSRLLSHSPLLVITSLLLGLPLALGGCDFGAAQQAVESMGVIVKLEPIETTVSGQIKDAATGELVETPVTLTFKGPGGEAVVDMYSDPISKQEVASGVTSFGIRNDRQPSPDAPVRLRVVANAEGYQPTSEVIQIHAAGTKQFVLNLLSTNPKQQPKGASGVRNRSGTAKDGNVASDLTVATPSDQQDGAAALHLPTGSRLHTRRKVAEGQLTVDLSYYPPTEATLDALPGSGTVKTNSQTERFAVAGYLHLRIKDASNEIVSSATGAGPDSTRPQTTVRLPDDAVHPSTGAPLQNGDELELFRYDPDAGTWLSDTTVTVRSFSSVKQRRVNGAELSGTSSSSGDLGVRWRALDDSSSGWWAWGTRSENSCEVDTKIQIDPNAQEGNVEIALQRSGLKYSNTKSVDDMAESAQTLSTLLGQSKAPRHEDYVLTFTTRDGQTRTVEGVDPCGGSYSTTLPEPTSTPRTDVLFRGYPECPSNQKVRITSVPTLTIYYREQDAPKGATWHTAGDDKITWVMDDPDNPTYIKWGELRLDGLKQDTRYEMYTTYDGERYEASALVPARDTATTEEGRVVVTYSQDFSEVCS